MQILDNIEEKQSRDLIRIKCDYCGKSFERPKNKIQAYIRNNVQKLFCSKDCQSKGQIKDVKATCLYCDKEFTSKNCNIKKSINHFCCRSHSSKYANEHSRLKKKVQYGNRLKELPLEKISEDLKKCAFQGEIIEKYKITPGLLRWLFKNGHLTKPTRSSILKRVRKSRINRPMSEEQKQKLSILRKQYLKDHGINRWQYKNAYHTSWLCETIKLELTKLNIQFVAEFQPLRDIGRYYSLDIAFPNIKIAFEINGRQHYDAKGELLPYYQTRHNLIEQNGWKLYEIKYDKQYSNIVNYVVNELKLVGSVGF